MSRPRRPGRAPEPVAATEVTTAVLETIATAFGDRPLDVDTARRGLALAAFELIQIHLREVSSASKKPARR